MVGNCFPFEEKQILMIMERGGDMEIVKAI